MLKIRPADAETVPAVRAFNARLRDGGSTWQFYDYVTPTWLSPAEGAAVWREHHILQAEDGTVRGGYVLKHETFLLDGEPVMVAHQQGPVAESVVDASLRGLGFKMVDDALKKRPLQIGWGATIRKGWAGSTSPGLFHVVNKTAFLRGLPAVRRRPLGRIAALGPGQLALAAVQARPPAPQGLATEEPAFGAWADEVWQAAKGQYKLIAVRDAATLNRLMPPGEWPNAIPLKVTRDGRLIGWAAIRDHRLTGDPQFGDLRAGSIVDALALPGEERAVIAAATRHLGRRGVDFVGSFFSHPAWIKAFKASGYLAIPNRRGIGFSDDLIKVGGGLDALLAGSHLTLIDADGPRVF